MARDTSRKITRSPNAAHVLGKRNKSGTLSTTTLVSTTGVGSVKTGTPQTVSTTMTNPDQVLFTSVTAKASSPGATNAVKVKLKRPGTTITATGSASATTLSTANTLTPPQESPTVSVVATVDSGTSSLTSVKIKRDQQWV